MSKKKHLFLFAGYSKTGTVDGALLYYVSNLNNIGDVIVCMDCDCKKSELKKLSNITIKSIAGRHGEYDFGSYKRAYFYAKENNLIKKYDYIHLVNDSVFGPTISLNNTIKKLEQSNTDATGLIVSTHKTHCYMESWFVCLTKKIFLSDWFSDFISNVKPELRKSAVTIKYEHGLTNLIQNNNCSWSGIYTFHGRYTYNNPKKLFQKGCPFIKKLSFTRHFGGLGKQINYTLNHCNKNAKKVILKSADLLYGENYTNWLLTKNPIKIIFRNFKYLLFKLKK